MCKAARELLLAQSSDWSSPTNGEGRLGRGAVSFTFDCAVVSADCVRRCRVETAAALGDLETRDSIFQTF